MGGREHVWMKIGNPVNPQPQKKTIKQNNFRKDLHSVRRLMFIMIAEIPNVVTSISGILFGDTNARKTSDKMVPSCDGRTGQEKIEIYTDLLERMGK